MGLVHYKMFIASCSQILFGLLLPFETYNGNVAEPGVIFYASEHLYDFPGGPERSKKAKDV